MLFRMASITRTLTQPRPALARCMSGHAPSHWLSDKEIDRRTLAHMDSLPIPEGSWKEDYSKNQSKYNIQLAVATGTLFVTLFSMYKAKCFEFNPHPPMKNEN